MVIEKRKQLLSKKTQITKQNRYGQELGKMRTATKGTNHTKFPRLKNPKLAKQRHKHQNEAKHRQNQALKEQKLEGKKKAEKITACEEDRL